MAELRRKEEAGGLYERLLQRLALALEEADTATRLHAAPPAELELRTSAPDKRLRFTWLADGSVVEVRLTSKGDAKTQVTIDQTRLPNAAAVKRQKAFWKAALDALQSRLAG